MPGLAAKPIIDIDVVVASQDDITEGIDLHSEDGIVSPLRFLCAGKHVAAVRGLKAGLVDQRRYGGKLGEGVGYRLAWRVGLRVEGQHETWTSHRDALTALPLSQAIRRAHSSQSTSLRGA